MTMYSLELDALKALIWNHCNHFKHTEPLRKILTINSMSMGTTSEADISKMWMDLEQHVSRIVWQGQNVIKKNMTMTFYNKKQQLYLDTDVLGVILRASLLHVRDKISLPRNEAANNAALYPIPFTSKRLTSTEICFGNIEWEALGIPYGLENILPLLFHEFM